MKHKNTEITQDIHFSSPTTHKQHKYNIKYTQEHTNIQNSSSPTTLSLSSSFHTTSPLPSTPKLSSSLSLLPPFLLYSSSQQLSILDQSPSGRPASQAAWSWLGQSSSSDGGRSGRPSDGTWGRPIKWAGVPSHRIAGRPCPAHSSAGWGPSQANAAPANWSAGAATKRLTGAARWSSSGMAWRGSA